jgi:hypothetical protein
MLLLEKAFRRGFGGLPLLDCGGAPRDFFLKPGDSFFQFVRGKSGNILAQHDIGQFLARLQIVQIHRLSLPFRFSLSQSQKQRKP